MDVAGIFQPTFLDWWFGGGIGTNLGASLIWVVIAGVAAWLLWPPLRARLHRFVDGKLARLHAHSRWMAELAAIEHRHITGQEPPPHPHFDLGKDSRADQR